VVYWFGIVYFCSKSIKDNNRPNVCHHRQRSFLLCQKTSCATLPLCLFDTVVVLVLLVVMFVCSIKAHHHHEHYIEVVRVEVRRISYIRSESSINRVRAMKVQWDVLVKTNKIVGLDV